jgi:hypothetical protein
MAGEPPEGWRGGDAMTSPRTRSADVVGREVNHIAARLRQSLKLIESAPRTDQDQWALLRMLVEQMLVLVARAWRTFR